MSEDRVVEASKQLAAALRPGDLDQTLSNITAAAVEVLPDVQWSSLTIKRADGRLETVAPTHDMLCEVDAAQYELQEGPWPRSTPSTSATWSSPRSTCTGARQTP